MFRNLIWLRGQGCQRLIVHIQGLFYQAACTMYWKSTKKLIFAKCYLEVAYALNENF